MTQPGATIGMDIGGTKISGCVMDSNGVILARARKGSPAQNPGAIVDEAADLIRELSLEREIDAVGVACAGLIDRTGSTVLFAPNLAWRDLPLKQLLESALDLPVTVENDANAAAWGEFRFGAAVGTADMVLVTVGTGIGGGVVTNGVLLRGAFGIAADA